jgi:Protein of unknown function (DUF551)
MTAEWISVDDRLPDLNVLVMGWTRAGELAVFSRDDGGGEGWLWARQMSSWNLTDPNGIEAEDDFEVTHWMPLPEGPAT